MNPHCLFVSIKRQDMEAKDFKNESLWADIFADESINIHLDYRISTVPLRPPR